jgi:nucleoid-associated protein YgaU
MSQSGQYRRARLGLVVLIVSTLVAIVGFLLALEIVSPGHHRSPPSPVVTGTTIPHSSTTRIVPTSSLGTTTTFLTTSTVTPTTRAPRPTTTTTEAPETTVAPTTTTTTSLPTVTYVVKPGDTLWAIALWFREQGYQALYEANIKVIGDNPNLIRPGQVLTISNGVMTVT